jgi:hypothetical protein
MEIQMAIMDIRGPRRRSQWRLVEATYTGLVIFIRYIQCFRKDSLTTYWVYVIKSVWVLSVGPLLVLTFF